MKSLSDKELKMIVGGGISISAWAIFGIIASVIFGLGVIDGYVRPLECN